MGMGGLVREYPWSLRCGLGWRDRSAAFVIQAAGGGQEGNSCGGFSLRSGVTMVITLSVKSSAYVWK